MTKKKVALNVAEVKGMFGENSEALRKLVQNVVQEVLNGEMENFLDATPYERTETRRGYRSGYYTRRMETRIGTLTLTPEIHQYAGEDEPRDQAPDAYHQNLSEL